MYLGDVILQEMFKLFPKNTIKYCNCKYPIKGKLNSDYMDYDFLQYAITQHRAETVIKDAKQAKENKRQVTL